MARMISLPPDAWAREGSPRPDADCLPRRRRRAPAILAEFHPAGQRALLRSGWTEHDVRDFLPQIAVPTLSGSTATATSARPPRSRRPCTRRSPARGSSSCPGSATWATSSQTGSTPRSAASCERREDRVDVSVRPGRWGWARDAASRSRCGSPTLQSRPTWSALNAARSVPPPAGRGTDREVGVIAAVLAARLGEGGRPAPRRVAFDRGASPAELPRQRRAATTAQLVWILPPTCRSPTA